MTELTSFPVLWGLCQQEASREDYVALDDGKRELPMTSKENWVGGGRGDERGVGDER